jgi:AcrR family transcriptional regulator
VTSTLPTDTAPTTEPAPGSTRDRLVTAAIAVFREQGYEGARVQDIARAAGLTTGAIYANYRGKAELLLDAITASSSAELDALLRDAPSLAPRDLLETLGSHLLHKRRVDRPLLLEAVVAARRDDTLAALLHERFAERSTILRAVVARGERDGSIDPTLDADALTVFSTTLAMGALVVRSLDLPVPDPDAWDALIARLLDGLAAPEQEPT